MTRLTRDQRAQRYAVAVRHVASMVRAADSQLAEDLEAEADALAALVADRFERDPESEGAKLFDQLVTDVCDVDD